MLSYKPSIVTLKSNNTVLPDKKGENVGLFNLDVIYTLKSLLPSITFSPILTLNPDPYFMNFLVTKGSIAGGSISSPKFSIKIGYPNYIELSIKLRIS